ncbi:MAG: hypothetical protein RIC87_20100 [Kiloniellales bacterium]
MGEAGLAVAAEGRVEVDRDGDGAADIFFLAEGISQAGQLTSADFLWT